MIYRFNFTNLDFQYCEKDDKVIPRATFTSLTWAKSIHILCQTKQDCQYLKGLDKKFRQVI